MNAYKQSFLSQIFTAYNQARASARHVGDLKRVDRLNKALGILLSSNYYQGEKETYQPSSFSCSCKDWEFRHAARRQYTGPCKHMLAESMILATGTKVLFPIHRTRVSIDARQEFISTAL